MLINHNETLAKASKDLMLREPMYGLFLIMLNKHFDDKFPTLGVSKHGMNYQLKIGTAFWNSLSPLRQIGLLKHECLHICFFHLDMIDVMPDHKIRNLACDMEINQYIDENWLPGSEGSKKDFEKRWKPKVEELNNKAKAKEITEEDYKAEMLKIPARGVLIKDYDELKLDLKAGSKYYYDKLSEAKDKKDKTGTSGCDMLDNMLDGQEPDEHPTWVEFEGMGEAERRLMRAQTEFTLREVAEQVIKSRGTIPGELAEILKMLDYKEPPKFDWKRYLRRFTGGSTKTYTKKLRRKFNKRYEDLPGLKVKQMRHVLVAVDTSGSVDNSELIEFFKEIHHISRTNTEVTILQCDSAISNVAKYKKGCENEIKIYGRGGTSFDPIIDYANSKTSKFTALIILTDGEAPAPEKCRIRTLWVHSSKSKINEDLIGLKIKLEL